MEASYLYTNVPELSSDFCHQLHVPAIDKVLSAPSLQHRHQELEGVFLHLRSTTAFRYHKKQNPPYKLPQRKRADLFPGHISTPLYSTMSRFPPTLLRNSRWWFFSLSELLCKATKSCRTALVILQVVKINQVRMTGAARNWVHESTDSQINEGLMSRINPNLLLNMLKVFPINPVPEHVQIFIIKSQHSPTPFCFQMERGKEEPWL